LGVDDDLWRLLFEQGAGDFCEHVGDLVELGGIIA
jgi:hypothetical protein